MDLAFLMFELFQHLQAIIVILIENVMNVEAENCAGERVSFSAKFGKISSVASFFVMGGGGGGHSNVPTEKIFMYNCDLCARASASETCLKIQQPTKYQQNTKIEKIYIILCEGA